MRSSPINPNPEKHFHNLGSYVTNVYDPEDTLLNPPRPSDITLELLLASQTHLGHSTSRWNPQNSRYIFGIRDGIHIISLDQTAAYLRRAAKVVEEVAARGGLILFAGTRKGQKRTVVRAAYLARAYHIFERWIPGSLTNGQQILGHCETKVVNALDQEIPALKPLLEDRAALKPDLVVCLNPIENEVLLHECGLNNVPTIGIIDTDADPTRVTYPIPSNDDSLRAVSVITGILGQAGRAGQRRRLDRAQKGTFTYEPVDLKGLGVGKVEQAASAESQGQPAQPHTTFAEPQVASAVSQQAPAQSQDQAEPQNEVVKPQVASSQETTQPRSQSAESVVSQEAEIAISQEAAKPQDQAAELQTEVVEPQQEDTEVAGQETAQTQSQEAEPAGKKGTETSQKDGTEPTGTQ